MNIRIPQSLSFVALLTFGAFLGCGDADHAISIDVRTDFSPADEFDAIQLTIDGADERIVADRGENYREGSRIHDGELAPGDHEVEVALTQSGRLVVSRRVLFRVDTDRGMTVVLSRSCANVVCGLTTTCVSGECVDPRCTPETPELCEDAPECAADDECAAGMCGVAGCVLGSCFQYDDGLCGADAFCVPSEGCQAREGDAGVGADATVDGRDVGVRIDAALVDGSAPDGSAEPDVGPFDAGPFDAGPFDAGQDVPAPTDTGGPDVREPRGACDNPADDIALDISVQEGINYGYACYGTHGNNADMIRTCVQARVGVSDMCADCFVQIVQCTVTMCSSECMSPGSAPCTACRTALCNPGFNTCSGFEI